jgi:hypothetical protein
MEPRWINGFIRICFSVRYYNLHGNRIRQYNRLCENRNDYGYGECFTECFRLPFGAGYLSRSNHYIKCRRSEYLCLVAQWLNQCKCECYSFIRHHLYGYGNCNLYRVYPDSNLDCEPSSAGHRICKYHG